ncbi:hypothetical protein Arub01_10340 [Actinomadura rubrobrunea]|uniref:Uncharacterized protein n=1 Tax=Actinomadura rubrobrunea TaxID=115335 RepID=A0A9W6PSH2_9ACTN|nr:hypothetical protein Arub01_10340 [Actinomadura rubrobrunea]
MVSARSPVRAGPTVAPRCGRRTVVHHLYPHRAMIRFGGRRVGRPAEPGAGGGALRTDGLAEQRNRHGAAGVSGVTFTGRAWGGVRRGGG